MTAATATGPAQTERPSALAVYRDDGPLARAVLAPVGRRLRLPALALAVAGLGPLLVAVAATRDGGSHALAAGVAAWLVLTGGAAAGRPHAGRMAWMVPPLLRIGEYVALVWLAVLAGASDEGAAFALLAAIAFRHYDLVYRLRHRGVTPPRWLNGLSAGWEGRVAIACAMLLADALPLGYYVLAAVFAVAFVSESAVSWTRFSRAQRPVMYEDEEDEGQ